MLTISLIVPVFVSTVKASPSTWSIETVDASASVGVDTSIAVDSNGYPHISYYDVFWGNLKYAKWTGSSWDITAPLDDGDGAGVGSDSSIDLDSNDYPHISYIDETNHDLKYAMWNGTAWSIETIHTVAAVEQTSIALDSWDYPHVSYSRESNGWLSYGVWGGMNWSFVSIDTSCVAQFSSIALDSLDRPHISYYDYTNGDLKYARWTGSIWINETIDFAGDVGKTTSIALDSDDNPYISYYDSTNADLKYAWWDGAIWNIEMVDSFGVVGEFTSIVLDSDDNPHIVYRNRNDYNLKYARWTGSVWSIEVVDAATDVGAYCSIALDSGDHPHISYWDSVNSNLKYARAPNEYFYSVYGTLFDSNGDGFSDAVQVSMDADTTYSGSLNVKVFAYLKDSLGNYVAFDNPLWSITSNAVEWGQAFLYLDAAAQEGYYDVELFLFDADNNYEDYRLFEDEVYLYPSQIGWLQGTIKDVDTELPMSTVDVYVNDVYITSTNATGQYSLELLAGDYKITAAESEGSLYESQTIDVTVIAGSITTQDFHLQRINWILEIAVEGSGTTNPTPGATTFSVDSWVPVEAFPGEGWTFDHWRLEDENIGAANPVSVFMDSNHLLTAVFIEYSTTASVESCNSAGDQKDYFDFDETVYIIGSGYSPSTVYNLYVVADIDWIEGMSIPTRISGTASNVASNIEGAIPSTVIWSNPQTIGKYDIVIDVNGDGVYNSGVDALDSNDVEVTAGLVLEQRAHLAVRGADNNLYYRIYSSLHAWNDWAGLPGGETPDSPAIAVCGNELHFVVRGADGITLYHGYLNRENSIFSGWTWITGTSPSPPTLSSNGTHLALILRGADNGVYYRTYSVAGRSWSSWKALPSGETCDKVSAVMVGDMVHFVVRGYSSTQTDGNNTLWEGSVDLDSDTFSGWAWMPGSVTSSPTLVEYNDELVLAVRGEDNGIYINKYMSEAWQGWSALPSGSTPEGPAAAVVGQELHFAVVGMDAITLWHSTLNLETADFSGWTWISGTTPSKPVLKS